ncbi:MAG: hypothetical protein JNK64_35985 [Myxococcales bacterium]|nr:hypothetical protein [Myxococcales bacterium]
MRTILGVIAGLTLGAQAAAANTPCRSDYWSSAVAELGGTIPSGCKVELYVPAGEASVQVVARIGSAPVAVTTSAVDTFAIRRFMDQCSTLDSSCWQWNTFDVPMAVLEVAPATPFPEGADVQLGDGTTDRVAVHIGPAGACPPRRPLAEEMCADPLGGPCTGGAFTCDNGDGGLALDAGVPGDHDGGGDFLDAPAAHDHGGGDGCAAGGGGLGTAAIALGALVARRRRR